MNNKRMIVAIFLLTILGTGLLGYLFISTSKMIRDAESQNAAIPVSQDNSEDAPEFDYDFTMSNDEETINESIDNIQREIDLLDLEVDFEDFDSELEFGLE